MRIKISSQPRPFLPYEHPNLSIYERLIKQNIIRHIKRHRAYPHHDEQLQHYFQNTQHSLLDQCEMLVRYVAEAFDHYAVWDYSHAYYPGRPGQQTVKIDALEGVSRVLPTLATWLHHSRERGGDTHLKTLNNASIDLPALIRSAFLAGTSPQHAGYWGDIEDYDQRICESADLALALWLSKQWVWDALSAPEQRQIIDWFKQVNSHKTVDNNWHLFPLTVQFVIKALTGEDTIDHNKYLRTKEFYVGDGWFRDGANGNYDYYNAWGFYYSLYWLVQIDPDYDRDFIVQALDLFNQKYRYFFTPEGLPFFGRSACYRLAASAPLIAGVDLNGRSVTCGEAKRALETNLQYFISQGAMRNGAPTQGLFGDDTRLVDNYSGPASSFWSLRALNIALYCGQRINFWQTPSAPLPIEQQDYQISLPSINALVIGTFETKEIVVIFKQEYTLEQTPMTRRLLKQRPLDKLIELAIGQSRRPKNNLLRKGITCYSSKMSHFF